MDKFKTHLFAIDLSKGKCHTSQNNLIVIQVEYVQ